MLKAIFNKIGWFCICLFIFQYHLNVYPLHCSVRLWRNFEYCSREILQLLCGWVLALCNACVIYNLANDCEQNCEICCEYVLIWPETIMEFKRDGTGNGLNALRTSSSGMGCSPLARRILFSCWFFANTRVLSWWS